MAHLTSFPATPIIFITLLFLLVCLEPIPPNPQREHIIQVWPIRTFYLLTNITNSGMGERQFNKKMPCPNFCCNFSEEQEKSIFYFCEDGNVDLSGIPLEEGLPEREANTEESQAERRGGAGRELACFAHPQTNNFHFLSGQCELGFCYLQPNDA